MVKLGVLCEGESETYILNSELFRNWLSDNGIELIKIQIVGSKNQYWQERIQPHISILKNSGVNQIVVMVDLDKDSCITETKNNIQIGFNQHIVVSVKEFENWYLADHISLSKLVRKDVSISFPELEEEPMRKITEFNGRGFGGSKPLLARRMRDNGFSIENAAAHPNCPSALYFLNKLKQIAVN